MTSFASLLPVNQRDGLLAAFRRNVAQWTRLSFRHDLLTARAVRGVQLEAQRLFDRTIINPLLRLVAQRVPDVQARTGDLARDLFPELVALRSAVEATVASGANEVRRLVEARVETLARSEVAWMTSSVASVVGNEFGAGVRDVFGAGVTRAAETSLRERVWLGDSTEKWFQKALTGPAQDTARAYITTGVKQGLTVREMTQAIGGTRTQAGILDRPKATAAALVRTASTHAANTSRMESFKALGVKHWRFVATLDLRTSKQCAANDGEVYPVGEGPIPPLHPNCRSIAVPELFPNREPRGQRVALGGQVPASTTFEDWFGTLTKAEQDRWAGPARAEAFRAGKLTLKDLVGRDLQPLTLDELEALDRL